MKKLSLPLLLIALTQSGCALIFGSVKSIEKSSDYEVMDLSERDEWVKLDSQEIAKSGGRDKAEETETTDLAYQSRNTAAIISLNSSCRENDTVPELDLRNYTDSLLLGVLGQKNRKEQLLRINNTDALQTTILGRVDSAEMKLRTVVLKSKNCIFDMMFVSSPEYFDQQAELFSNFANSFRFN